MGMKERICIHSGFGSQEESCFFSVLSFRRLIAWGLSKGLYRDSTEAEGVKKG